MQATGFNAVVEKAAGVAAGVCVAAAGGTGVLQSIGGAMVAGVGLYALFREATQKCRLECDQQLAKLTSDIKERLLSRHPEYADDYEDAAARLVPLLELVLPDFKALANLANDPRGLAESAADSILRDLRDRGAGFDRDPKYEAFATEVIQTAVELAFVDPAYFVKLEPHLWLEALQALGSIEGKIDQVLERLPARPFEKELSPALRGAKRSARASSRRHDFGRARELWAQLRDQATAEGEACEALLADLEIAVLDVEQGKTRAALRVADACLQRIEAGDLGKRRGRALQIIGEIHRATRDFVRARAFLTASVDFARSHKLRDEEGYALLALAALTDQENEGPDGDPKVSDLLNGAYSAFVDHLTSGDLEERESAQRGIAMVHVLRATIAPYDRADEKAVEWTRAIKQLRSLGESSANDLGDALMHRAEARIRLGEWQGASEDFAETEKIFRDLDSTEGLARCYLSAGECLDHIGKRQEAIDYYQAAAQLAAQWDDDRQGSYFYYRCALKMAELGQREEAIDILTGMAQADWLEPELKLRLAIDLAMLTYREDGDPRTKTWSDTGLQLVADLSHEATSTEERRSLLVQKCQLLEVVGRHREALTAYEEMARRAETSSDRASAIESWSRIRSVRQHLRDKEGEREAAERVLELGAEQVNPMIASVTLLMLAQLNIEDQRYEEAEDQLDRAVALGENNPAIDIVAPDLRSKLPKLSRSATRHRSVSSLSERWPELLDELRRWVAEYPSKRRGILHVWFAIHSRELWEIFRSTLGLKFLIAAPDAKRFEEVRGQLWGLGEMYVWGTNFNVERLVPKSPRGLERVPVLRGSLIPAGTTVLGMSKPDAPEERSTSTTGGTSNSLPDKPYFLTPMRGDDGKTALFYVGRKHKWKDRRVIDFMLDTPTEEMLAMRSVCLPLAESESAPNLANILRTAWQNNAIPVFSSALMADDRVTIECECGAPLGPLASPHLQSVKRDWVRLLELGPDRPRSELHDFAVAMQTIASPPTPGAGQTARVLMLRFETGGQPVVIPALALPHSKTRH